jgi:DHA2 family multidrug resistance protein
VCWFTAITIVSLILFIVRQLQIEYPIVDLRILTNRNFAVGTALITVMGLVLYSTIAMLPLYLQTVMGYSALMSGLTITPRGFGAFLSNVVVGRIIAFVDTRFLIAVGLTVLGLSGLMFSHMNLDISMPNIVWPNILNGVGAALVFASLATTTMGRLKNEQMGNAAGIFNLMRNIGGSIGIAAVATFLARWSQVHQGILVSHLTPYDPAYQRWLATTRAALVTGVGALDADPKSLGLLYGVLGQQARLMAFMDIFQVTSIIALLAVPLVLLFKKTPTGKAPSGD